MAKTKEESLMKDMPLLIFVTIIFTHFIKETNLMNWQMKKIFR